eukprot:2169563-Rhodomonas_salina.2
MLLLLTSRWRKLRARERLSSTACAPVKEMRLLRRHKEESGGARFDDGDDGEFDADADCEKEEEEDDRASPSAVAPASSIPRPVRSSFEGTSFKRRQREAKVPGDFITKSEEDEDEDGSERA